MLSPNPGCQSQRYQRSTVRSTSYPRSVLLPSSRLAGGTGTCNRTGSGYGGGKETGLCPTLTAESRASGNLCHLLTSLGHTRALHSTQRWEQRVREALTRTKGALQGGCLATYPLRGQVTNLLSPADSGHKTVLPVFLPYHHPLTADHTALHLLP